MKAVTLLFLALALAACASKEEERQPTDRNEEAAAAGYNYSYQSGADDEIVAPAADAAASAPADAAAPSAEVAAVPSDAAAPAVEVAAVPSDAAAPAAEVAAVPSDAAAPSAEVAAVPSDAATPAAEVAAVPSDAAAPAAEVAAVPSGAPAPPADVAAPHPAGVPAPSAEAAAEMARYRGEVLQRMMRDRLSRHAQVKSEPEAVRHDNHRRGGRAGENADVAQPTCDPADITCLDLSAEDPDAGSLYSANSTADFSSDFSSLARMTTEVPSAAPARFSWNAWVDPPCLFRIVRKCPVGVAKADAENKFVLTISRRALAQALKRTGCSSRER